MLTPLSAALEELARAGPERPALTSGDLSLSRRALQTTSDRLARAYAERGVGAGSTVTIALPNGVEFLLATVAIWKLGAVPHPLSRTLPRHERDRQLHLAAPDLVVGLGPDQVPDRPTVPDGAGPGPAPGTAVTPPAPRIAPAWKLTASGGTTGRPRLVRCGRGAAAETLRAYAGLLGLPADSVHLVAGPLHHDPVFAAATAALLTGNHVVVMPRFEPAELLALVARHQVDSTYLTPAALHRTARLPRDVRAAADLSSLGTLIHGSEACPGWLKRGWMEWLGSDRVHEVYRPVEGLVTTRIGGTEWNAHRGSVGRPVEGRVRVLDESGADVPTGTAGEVWAAPAPGLPGRYAYVGSPPGPVTDGWEPTGDQGRLDAAGYLHLAGPRSDLIHVDGAAVSPAEVEAALDEFPAVRASCVIGLPDRERGQIVHAIIETGDRLDTAALRDHLRDRLLPYAVPRHIERVSEPLRDDVGRVRRRLLRADRVIRAGLAASAGV